VPEEASPTPEPKLDEAEAEAVYQARDEQDITPGEPHDIEIGGEPVHPGAENEGAPEEVELTDRDQPGHPTDSDVARIAEGEVDFDQENEAGREAELPGPDEAQTDDQPDSEPPGAGR
jgi:hypothetical protein